VKVRELIEDTLDAFSQLDDVEDVWHNLAPPDDDEGWG